TGDSVYYALDGGAPQSSGAFSGLSAGDYEITITDKWGCQETIFLTVDREPGIVLSAWAGNDFKCREELAYSTITASNFINIAEYKAVLGFDDTRLNCTGYNPAIEFPDVVVTNYPDKVEINWQSTTPKTLPGTVPLVDLIFETINWGTADIKWDTAYSVFKDGNGNIMADSLQPGVITINNPPGLENNSQKTEFCEGEEALIEFNYTGGTDPVNTMWQTPDNANVPGLTYAIDSIKLSQAGTYTILATDFNNCKDTLRIPVTVYAKPATGFESVDTIWYEQEYRLEATPGYAGYEWNTGDTIYYITVTKEGEYSVLIETEEGCEAMESVFMFDAFVPVNVPNAFTPNGDGMNDTFGPIVNTELIRRYHLSIYNKWGQLLFETSDPGKGWDGEKAMAGVYVWVIDFENRVGRAEMIKGSLAIIK
ncbi:MAG TPA: gliding motility-associated C-terminal domain-containing protein, partial [Lentimicrobium sp.]|nr:gliding motility-associated C-terminal domain-containing protein [Lentimicrobium sp.]